VFKLKGYLETHIRIVHLKEKQRHVRSKHKI